MWTEGERVRVEITESALPQGWSGITSTSDGAVVVFVGVVRDRTDDRSVDGLHYESYSEMALSEMRSIADEAISRFEVGRIWMVHRIGELTVGEASVFIGVSAPHRGPAFDACEYCIDTLKERVPIWKKEVFSDGQSRWVEHP